MKTNSSLINKPTVLVIDDDRISQNILVSFSSENYSIVVADSSVCAFKRKWIHPTPGMALGLTKQLLAWRFCGSNTPQKH